MWWIEKLIPVCFHPACSCLWVNEHSRFRKHLLYRIYYGFYRMEVQNPIIYVRILKLSLDTDMQILSMLQAVNPLTWITDFQISFLPWFFVMRWIFRWIRWHGLFFFKWTRFVLYCTSCPSAAGKLEAVGFFCFIFLFVCFLL